MRPGDRLSGSRRGALVISLALLVALATAAVVSAASPGRVDTTFGTNGVALLGSDTKLLGSAVQPDGKLVAVGVSGEKADAPKLLVARFTVGGQLDRSFSNGTVVGGVGTVGNAVAIQPDGKIVVAGSVTNFPNGMLVLRLNRNGSIDRSFSGDGLATALPERAGEGRAVAIQQDGKIVVGGSATLAGGPDSFPRLALARFTKSGGLDSGFGQGGTAVFSVGRLSYANAVAIQDNGRIVAVGQQRDNLQTTLAIAIRAMPGGGLDSGFGGNAGVPGLFARQYSQGAAYSAAFGLALAAGGKIVLGGAATSAAVGGEAFAARLNANGTSDNSFSGDGAAYVTAVQNRDQFNQSEPYPGAYGVALSGNDVILAGYFDALGQKQIAVWGLGPGGALDSRFGQNGQTIVALPGYGQFRSLSRAPDGSLYGVGDFSSNPIAAPFGLAVRYGGFPVPVELTVRVNSSYKLGPALARGIPVRFTCSGACDLNATLKARGSIVAKAKGRLGATGSKTLRLRFTRAGKRKLAGIRRVTASLVATARGGGRTDRVTRQLVLRR